MKKSQDMTIYEYLINTLTTLNLIQVYKELNHENNLVDELKRKTLNVIDSFEEINNFDPRANLTLTVKLIAKVNDKLLFVKNKKALGLITFNPPFVGGIESEILKKTEDLGLILKKNPTLKAFYNAYELLKKEPEDLKNPSYVVLYELDIDESSLTSSSLELTNDLDKLNSLDLAIVERN